MSISEFKATCLAVLERVRTTGRPLVVTRHGKPVAEIMPPSTPAPGEIWIGSMVGRATINGDIVGPIGSIEDWDVFRE